MKPIAVITADIHARRTNPKCRKDNYFETMKNKLFQICKFREANEMPIHLDAGDLFHSWKAAPAVEAMMFDSIPAPFISIPGNHEIPYHNLSRLEDSSWYVMQAAGRISKNKIGTDFSVTSFPYGAELKPCKSNAKFKIALYHGMVWQKKPTWDGVEGMEPQELLAALPGYNLIISGHNHQSFLFEEDGCRVLNPGSMMRSSIDQLDYIPVFWILWDDYSLTKQDFVIDADVFNLDLYEREKERDSRMQSFVERVQGMEGFTVSFEDNLNLFCKQNKIKENVIQEIMEAVHE